MSDDQVKPVPEEPWRFDDDIPVFHFVNLIPELPVPDKPHWRD